tara:strand:+ start:2007 stop:2762 length:756 start_codon:yes stop_codon:yes gene_type:complete
MGKEILFIGVGPGDPDLLTVKAMREIKSAEVIFWTDSLIPKKIINLSNENCERIKTSNMNLEDITTMMIERLKIGKKVIRLHDGDPCLFGAISEQIRILKESNIQAKVIPGVSAFQVTAAYHQAELTIPEVTQTIILSRSGGRTEMPERESLRELARIKSSLCLYLSARHVEKAQKILSEFYDLNTKVIVGYRVSWEDGWTSLIELKDMAKFSLEKKLIRTTIYIISPALSKNDKASNLYDPNYEHLFRQK